MTNDGTNTYQWDVENRLIQINYTGTGNYSQFSYDGVNRVVRIVETRSSVLYKTKQFVRLADSICEARDVTFGYAVTNQMARPIPDQLLTNQFFGCAYDHALTELGGSTACTYQLNSSYVPFQ